MLVDRTSHPRPALLRLLLRARGGRRLPARGPRHRPVRGGGRPDRHVRLVRQGPLRGRPRRGRQRPEPAPDARPGPPGRRADPRDAPPAHRQRPGPDRAGSASSAGRISSSTPSAPSPTTSDSTRRSSPSSSPRSPRNCPRSSTRSSGSTSARTRSRWATSPGRWSSRAPSRPCRAAVRGRRLEHRRRLPAGLRLGGDRLRLDPRDLRARAVGGPAGPSPARGRGVLPRIRRPGHRGPRQPRGMTRRARVVR